MASPRSPRLHTPFCDRLEIEVPIISAGMGPISGPDLTAAVSNARGLGVLGCTSMSADEVRAVIRRTRELTDRPFGVDLILPARLDQGGVSVGYVLRQVPAEHREFAARMATELGAEPRDGAEVVIAQGAEGGGHTGHVGTMALLPQVLDAVDVPVVAAGGIGDGRGVAAALVMGCQAVWIGTRFLATPEAGWRRGKGPGSWLQPTSRRS